MATIAIPDDFPVVIGGRAALERIRALGDVRYFDAPAAGEDDLIERIGDADIVVNIRSRTRFTPRVLGAARRLKLLAVWGTGTDNIDLAAARDCGVTVSNTPNTATESIAEHTLALMFTVARRLVELDAAVKAGEWPRAELTQLAGKTLGIVGTGAIGTRTAELGRVIGMRVLAWSFRVDLAKAIRLGFQYVDLDHLLSVSDVVSIHLRLSPRTQGLIGAAQLARMKPGAILVNTARGAIVDSAALADALRERRIAGAGLDVFEQEPLPAGDPITRLPHVVLTPHLAGQVPEALERSLNMVADNIAAFLHGRPSNVVVRPA